MATATAVVAALIPSAAQANHAWGNYHWARTSNPFTLRVDNNVTSAWTSYLNEAASRPHHLTEHRATGRG